MYMNNHQVMTFLTKETEGQQIDSTIYGGSKLRFYVFYVHFFKATLLKFYYLHVNTIHMICLSYIFWNNWILRHIWQFIDFRLRCNTNNLINIILKPVKHSTRLLHILKQIQRWKTQLVSFGN